MPRPRAKAAEQPADSLRGLDRVRVKKADLLKKIKANREDHRKIFEEALEGWQKQVLADLEDAVADAKAGKGFRWRFNLVKPKDHTDDYDSVIALLEMSQDTEFELDFQDFQCYVMDKWAWQKSFLTTSSTYGSTTAGGKFGELNYDADE